MLITRCITGPGQLGAPGQLSFNNPSSVADYAPGQPPNQAAHYLENDGNVIETPALADSLTARQLDDTC